MSKKIIVMFLVLGVQQKRYLLPLMLTLLGRDTMTNPKMAKK